MLEVLEQVAGEPELGRRDGVAARELERERRLAVVEDEAVVLRELVVRLAGPQRPGLAVGDDRQLEHVLAAVEACAVALADDTACLVDERERAADVVAQDRQQRRRSLALEDGVGEPLVHLERALQARELRVREPRRDRLRQRDEGHLVRDGDEREVEPLRLVCERRRRLGPAEADPEREPCEAVARPGGARTRAGVATARRRRARS